ncbi:SAM-dependent methyltransferase [Streptomyces sp. NPDC005423]|uniref:SAM-dependent methyltransferase n=1 Tax=Streptomyces sp. NPDC005423 TaxID=3155343 RepID=UPI0033A1B482
MTTIPTTPPAPSPQKAVRSRPIAGQHKAGRTFGAPTRRATQIAPLFDAPSDLPLPTSIDTGRPHSARVWNCLMGGKDHYTVDEMAAAALLSSAPQVRDMACQSRDFLIRTVTHLTRDCGVRQFLDIGAGLPAARNTHEVAQQFTPDAAIVYIDNDPISVLHAQTLLYGTAQGITKAINADLHDPDEILHAARRTLDFTQPVALLLMGVLGHIPDYAESVAIVRRLKTALPRGSYVAHYDGINSDPGLVKAQQAYNGSGAAPYILRSPDQLARYYEELDVLRPGIGPCALWRPDPSLSTAPADISGGVGRTP